MNSHRAPRSIARLSALLFFALNGCGRPAASAVPADPPLAPGGAPALYTYEVVHRWPHARDAFTEGLVYRNGDMLESDGLYGQSTLRDVDLRTGRIEKELAIPPQYFAEGLAVIGDKAYQLTWRSQVGFIYDAGTFQKLGEFHYQGEGWGLTNEGSLLVMSDGTSRIRFIDPADFHLVRSIQVTARGRPVSNVNELEWVRGEIFANVWETDQVIRIDPSDGKVRGVIDFSGLLPPLERVPGTDVLNGIAYDAARGRLFVTGKNWPEIFEVRIIPPAR